MAPQLLGDGARLAVLARVIGGLALGAVAQEQQPPLLLGNVVLPLPGVLGVRVRVRCRPAVLLACGRKRCDAFNGKACYKDLTRR